MPSLANHQSNTITKMLLMGDSGTAKTGSLVSLVQAGYKLRILDFDNGLDSLVAQIKTKCPDKLGNVAFETLRDKMKMTQAGPVLDGVPQACIRAMNMLNHWKDSDGTDLGVPATWGADTVLVIDSLTFFSEAAFNWAEVVKSGTKDRRQIYGEAQSLIENMLAMLTGGSMNTNVIVIAHTKYMERPDGTSKGFPTSVGNALSPKIPAYFNSVALATSTGAGTSLKRQIQTVSTGLIDLKNPASMKMAPALPIETALADFFKTIRS